MIIAACLRVVFLIGIALLGFIVGRRLKIDPRGIATLLFYVVAPFVVFTLIMKSSAELSYLYFSLAACVFSCGMAFLAFCLGKVLWKDARSRLLGFSGGTSNTGYFGLPLIMGLFDEESVIIAVFIIIGMGLYEYSYGFYLTSSGKYSVKDSLKMILRMPMLYAMALALSIKFFGVRLHETLALSLENFNGAYSVLGMMVIGLTLSRFSHPRPDWKFIGTALAWKHFIYPLTAIFIAFSFSDLDREGLFLISLMAATPMAVNTVIVSNELGIYPEKAAFAVVLSTLFSLFSIPLLIYGMKYLMGF